MDVVVKRRIERIEAQLRELRGRVGDVEEVQVEQLKRSDRVEKSLQTVLICLRRMDEHQRRFRNRTEAAIQEAISAAGARTYGRRR